MKKITEKQLKLINDRKRIKVGHGKYSVEEKALTIDQLFLEWGSKIVPYEGQRRPGIWPDERKRNFIACLLLGKHFNSFEVVLMKDQYENDDGNLVDRWDIIDGLQRLSTIMEFVEPDRVDPNNSEYFDKIVLTQNMAIRYGEEGLRNLGWDKLTETQKKDFKKINLNFKIHNFEGVDGQEDLRLYFQNLQQSSILTESEKFHSKYCDNATYLSICNHLFDVPEFRSTFKSLKDKDGNLIRRGLMKEDRGTSLAIGLNLFMLFKGKGNNSISVAEQKKFLDDHKAGILDTTVEKISNNILTHMKNIKTIMGEKYAYSSESQKGSWRMNGNLVVPMVVAFSKFDFQSKIKGNSIKVASSIKVAISKIKESSDLKGADTNEDRINGKIKIIQEAIQKSIS